MTRSHWTLISITLLAALLALSTGCARKKNPSVELDTSAMRKAGNQVASADANRGSTAGWTPGGAPGSDAGSGGFSSSLVPGQDFATDSTGSIPQNANTSGIEAAAQIADLEMIHFAFDRSEIQPEWLAVLDDHAQWLKNNPLVHIQVEGHCDERGTEEYNIALGQRRADSVRSYLVEQGVDASRISTISYGKMRPLTFDASEEGHALNRRAMFLVYVPDSSF